MSKCCRNFIIFILNCCTGGIGTIISPFLFKFKYNCRNILVAIIIGIIQILHFVHLLSLIFKFKFIDNFYDIIAGENILKPLMSDKYKIFINTTKEIEETLEDYTNEDENEMINPNEILSKDSRISFLKVILIIISSLSYINSNLNPLIDLINDNKANFKMLTLGISNPGAGLFILGILFFNKKECSNIIISLIGVIFGILLMLSPYCLGIGLYLVKIIKDILNLYWIKFLFIYFGTVGTIFSLIYGVLQNNLDKEDYENNQFDIDFKYCSKSYDIKSNFGKETIIRIICNIFIPGSGIFSLLCKFRCHVGIVFIGISQVVSGFFIYVIFLALFLNKTGEKDENVALLFMTYFFSNYIAGILIIFISDYFTKRPTQYDGFAIFPLTILNLLTGGYGNLITIYNSNNCFCKNICENCIATFFKIIYCIIGFGLQFFILFVIFTDSDTTVTACFSVIYSLYIVLSFIFHCVGRNEENEDSFLYLGTI